MAGEMKAPNAKEMTGQALQRALGERAWEYERVDESEQERVSTQEEQAERA